MPEPFRSLTSRAFVIRQADVDTDQIVPARFLTTTTREGLGRLAFHDWRHAADGTPRPEAPLNRIDPAERRILLAGPNFGCGSSREHAPWALLDYGFRAVVSTRIADIFTSNALKNGLLPVEAPQAAWDGLADDPDAEITIDLEACEIRRAGVAPVPFTVDGFARRCLLDGTDPLGWLLSRLPEIEAFERKVEHA